MRVRYSLKQMLRIVFPLALAAMIVSILAATASSAGVSMRVSTSSGGVEGDGHSTFSSVSGDGRYVAFESSAANIAYDNNGVTDIFLKDTQTGQTTLVSTSSDGVLGDGGSSRPSLSSDGRFVAFQSSATNLVTGDTNSLDDVFVKDLQTGETTRVSTNSAGNQVNMHYHSHSASISADGRYVAFMTIGDVAQGQGYTNGATDVFVKDRQTGQTSLVSSSSTGGMANHYSWDCAISADGRYVAFSSTASNLVAGDTNSARDIFVKDRQTGLTTRVSTNSDGVQGNGSTGWILNNTAADVAISGDGRYVVFHSNASNIAYGDSNGAYDIFSKDLQTGLATRVSTSSSGAEANGASSQGTSVSADGRFVTFTSDASNLVPGDTNSLTDVFVKDLATGQTARLSTDSSGAQAGPGWEECFGDPYEDVPEDIYCVMHGGSLAPSISADGSSVSFHTEATNLVSGDTNGFLDVMLAGNGFWEPADTIAPVVSDIQPSGVINTSSATVSAYFSDAGISSGIDPSTASLNVSGGTVSDCVTDSAGISCTVAGLADGDHEVTVTVSDFSGNTGSGSGTFTVVTCVSSRPVLNLSATSAYWDSYADYEIHRLSLSMSIFNDGSGTSFNTRLVGTANTMGVSTATAMPVSLGDIEGGGVAFTTLLYDLPAEVTAFKTTIYGTATDVCGTTYGYPGAMPGA